MADQNSPGEQHRLGLVEYALIIALVAVVVIGVLIVLAPAITTIIHTFQTGSS